MKRVTSEAILSAVFVDYDNIYLSLKRKNEEAARRFAKDAPRWLSALQTGDLITPNIPDASPIQRRMVMNRCYGNPVPRRNQADNSTDMNSFPFVRHHFLRSGFEIIDCPPLTAQLKNSSDIKMVMDLRDFLTHETYFEEFVILSSDADFTPVLHRLRAHNRRTVIFANDNTAAPYTAIADAEVREHDLIAHLLGELLKSDQPEEVITHQPEERVALADEQIAAEPAQPVAAVAIEQSSTASTGPSAQALLADVREQIINVVAEEVRTAPAPLPLEAAAERATRLLGHELTVATQWGGCGSFLELLREHLPEDVRLSAQTPPVLYDQNRVQKPAPQPSLARPTLAPRLETAATELSVTPSQVAPTAESSAPSPTLDAVDKTAAATTAEPEAALGATAQQAIAAEAIQRSIARIHDASQAPPLSPPDYRILFEEMAAEIGENDLQGVQTIANVEARTQARGAQVPRENIRFVLDVVGEQDPWFENGASAPLFSGRFRNFVVQRCRTQGLTLTKDELELIDAWFAGTSVAAQPAAATGQTPGAASQQPQAGSEVGTDWWNNENGQNSGLGGALPADDMPRLLRS